MVPGSRGRRSLIRFASYLRDRVKTYPGAAWRAGPGGFRPVARRLHRRADDAEDCLAILDGGHSHPIWARFVVHQNLPTVLRCHIAAFEAIGGAPREVLYDWMKTAVIGEGQTEGIVYNRASLTWLVTWIPSQSMQALSGQDKRQGRAAVPLYSGRLLPGPIIPQSR